MRAERRELLPAGAAPEGAFMPAEAFTAEARRREWIRYYSAKRIHEQLLQVSLLEGLAVDTVLEIGPYFGLVTAMLDNAGFAVTTMDMLPRSFARPERPHIEMDLTRIEPDKLRGFDCIMCCATLEHIHYEQAVAALAAFRDAGPRYILVSVPYQGTQLFFQLYANRHMLRRHFAFKKLRGLRRFRFDAAADPHGHKWEIGYRGYSLKRYEAMLRGLGLRIVRRDFSHPSYAVFHLLEIPTPAA
jgi:hypothetical protein